MRKISTSLVICLFAVVCFSLRTDASPLYPEPTGYITDTTGTLKEETKQQLVPILRALHEKTTAQVALAVVDTIGGEPIENYAVKLFEKWKVGTKGKDNGVLFVIALKDRKMKIEVGYGLEGALPDAKAGEILTDLVRPKFKEGDIDGGVIAGMEAVIAVVAEEYKVSPVDIGMSGTAPVASAAKQSVQRTSDKGGLGETGKTMLLVFAFIVIFIVVIFSRKKGQSFISDTPINNISDDSSYDSSSSSDSSDSFDGGSSGGGGASSDW